ncbi:hypothetical protein PF005_g25625 [Phytophthora fragariae]|uniref:DDE-1 domain-containing protein n=1 Tax=Phytophthora fragariae TaxID=53985 RepID=A0A6A4BSK6_9STRA|nr:hypothetical protein PF003_g23585 [Phytophthora fragariae]KAE8922059.1 hypothetical protein PF009_g27670 [Phytophthora fragariae]KAE8971989.1 hypothetical protein PF011_g25819 [Phytophthora fragariae]KAE9077112.1 hypothetical protein PF010_g23639 [Phytophthora fragariae]KAE9097270.1 hypothetical protein PF006_g23609 [Phytophthora fragariae]
MREQISEHHRAEETRRVKAVEQAELERQAELSRQEELARALELARRNQAPSLGVSALRAVRCRGEGCFRNADGAGRGEEARWHELGRGVENDTEVLAQGQQNEDAVNCQAQVIANGNWLTYRDCSEYPSDTASNTPEPRRRSRRPKKKKKGDAFELVAPSRTVIAAWISDAWNNLTTGTIVGGFAHINLVNDTRPVASDTSDMTSEINSLLASMAAISLVAPASRLTRISPADDIVTAEETTDSSDSSSE